MWGLYCEAGGIMNNKKTLNEIGIKYAIMAVIVLCVQFFSAFLLKKYNMEWLKENVVFASYILSIVCNDFLALLIILVLTKNMPKCNFPKRKLGVGNALTVYSISISIVLVGGLLGNFLQLIITGKVGNAAGDLISSGSNFILGLVSVGIIAPVFEELVFRKILIDRLGMSGKYISAVVSGLFFGLFHGNLSQSFFAACLGFLFSSVYIRTGRIIYTILFHMAINMPSAIISNISTNAMAMYSLYMLLMAFVGFFMLFMKLDFIRLRKIDEQEGNTDVKVYKTVFTSWGVWAFIAVCAVVFYLTYS